jgi:hypothetical protein
MYQYQQYQQYQQYPYHQSQYDVKAGSVVMEFCQSMTHGMKLQLYAGVYLIRPA